MYSLYRDSEDDYDTYVIINTKTGSTTWWFHSTDNIPNFKFISNHDFKRLKKDVVGKLILIGIFPEIPTTSYLKSNYPELLI